MDFSSSSYVMAPTRVVGFVGRERVREWKGEGGGEKQNKTKQQASRRQALRTTGTENHRHGQRQLGRVDRGERAGKRSTVKSTTASDVACNKQKRGGWGKNKRKSIDPRSDRFSFWSAPANRGRVRDSRPGRRGRAHAPQERHPSQATHAVVRAPRSASAASSADTPGARDSRKDIRAPSRLLGFVGA